MQSRSCQEIPAIITMVPPTICRWSIHLADYKGSVEGRDRTPSPPLLEDPDPNDEASWSEWPASLSTRSFTETIQQGLETNSFTKVRMRDLPIGLGQIVKAVKRSPNELLVEALGFSIMGRNIELVMKTISEIRMKERSESSVNISGLHPFHLATIYLDGSKHCCNILDYIVGYNPTLISVRKLYRNDLGHTILDNLMITILRSHTSCSANMVDEAFTKNHRFAGEEVDICGRWDADSDCVRHLLANGNPAIPFEWKHMFCHTSAQAICHCIAAVFGPHWGPEINSPSGLFTQRCSNPDCGEKLILYPLHTLVLTAIHLSESGCKGENLFGILACLLCLLSNGANPLLKAQISSEALLGRQLTENCTHKELDPAELTNQVPESVTSKWSPTVQTGWRIFCYVLRDSQAEWRPKPAREEHDAEMMESMGELYSMHPADIPILPYIYGMDGVDLYDDIGMAEAPFSYNPEWNASNDRQNTNDTEVRDAEEERSSDVEEVEGNDDRSQVEGLPAKCDIEEWHRNYFGSNSRLATLWAAVQTELVTYRRLREGDSWISPYFDMQALLRDLEDPEGADISIDLVRRRMMKEFCDCGIFFEADDYADVRMEEVSSHYFSNLEQCEWTRRKYIDAYEGPY